MTRAGTGAHTGPVSDTTITLTLDEAQRITQLFAGGPEYVAINGTAGRDDVTTIRAYVEGGLVVEVVPDRAGFVAIVPAGYGRFFAERLGSGLIGASVAPSFGDAVETVADGVFDALPRPGAR